MADYLRKGFLLGLGVALSGKERLDKRMDEWKLDEFANPEQARQALRRYMEKGETKHGEWDAKQREQFDKLLDDLGLVRKEELRELEIRLKKLEVENSQNQPDNRPEL